MPVIYAHPEPHGIGTDEWLYSFNCQMLAAQSYDYLDCYSTRVRGEELRDDEMIWEELHSLGIATSDMSSLVSEGEKATGPFLPWPLNATSR